MLLSTIPTLETLIETHIVGMDDTGFFQIDAIPIRYQRFLVVSIPNFDTDTSKFETYSTFFL